MLSIAKGSSAEIVMLPHIAVLIIFLFWIILSLERDHSDIFRKMTKPFSSFNWRSFLLYCTKLEFQMVEFYQCKKPSTLKCGVKEVTFSPLSILIFDLNILVT